MRETAATRKGSGKSARAERAGDSASTEPADQPAGQADDGRAPEEPPDQLDPSGESAAEPTAARDRGQSPSTLVSPGTADAAPTTVEDEAEVATRYGSDRLETADGENDLRSEITIPEGVSAISEHDSTTDGYRSSEGLSRPDGLEGGAVTGSDEAEAWRSGIGSTDLADASGYDGAGAPSSVSADGPSSVSAPDTTRPAFTRPPGMVPPPDQPDTPATGWTVDLPSVAGLTGAGSAASSTTAPGTAPPRPLGMGGIRVQPTLEPTGPGAGRMRDARPRPGAAPRGPRRARLHLRRIDPWSVMKFSFAVSLVLFIVVIVATSVLYLTLDTMGVFSSINETVADLIQAGEGGGFQITAQGVIGTAAVLGALNILLFTSLATLAAFIYNVCADLVGGIEVTLAERD